MTTIEKIFARIIKCGLWIIPLLPLYISDGMLFPFITGKNFAFRIIVEICFALWIGLAVMRKDFRPRLTLLVKAVTVFVVVVFLADLFSPNSYRAFFANYERMEGFMMIFHLYLYFLILVSVFRKRDWTVFFHMTLIGSFAVSFIGLIQKLGLSVSLQGGFRVDSTIGNPTYLAAYLLFHLWLLCLLTYRFWDKVWLRFLYAGLFVFEFMILYFTATRGAVLALLIVAVMFLVALTILWNKVFYKKEAKTYSLARVLAIAFLASIIIVPLFLWSIRNTEFVSSTNVLRRLTNYSLQERTIQSRFHIWHMSFQGALERPIFGWGQENYYIVFQKFYEPELYSSEPWFDRSHNIIFDWMIHTGFVGLLSFLSIFGILFWKIIEWIRREAKMRWEGLVLLALYLTYLLQNFFVFDNLNTYLLLFGFLAYTNFAVDPSEEISSKLTQQQISATSRVRAQGTALSFLAFLVLIFVGYFIHLKPIWEGRALIRALGVNQGGSVDERIAAFREALSFHTFGDTEVREQLANAARNILTDDKYTPEEKKRLVEFAKEEFTKELSDTKSRDVKHMLFLASVLDRAANLDPHYIIEAEGLIKDAIVISPRKQILYFELVQVYLAENRIKDALDAMKTAHALAPQFQQAAVNLLTVANFAQDKETRDLAKSYIVIDQLDEELLRRVWGVYQKTDDFQAALPVFDRLLIMHPDSAQYLAVRAVILARLGKIDQAIADAQHAAAVDPSFAKEAEIFINQLKQGQKP